MTTARLVATGFDVLDGHVTDQLRLGELVGGREPFTELPRGPPGQLLHPAHAESERFAQDAVVVGVVLVPRRSGSTEHAAGSTAAGATRGGVSASTIGLRARISVSLKPSWRAPTSTRKRDRRPGHPVVAGLGEHPHHDLVGVQRTEDHSAPMHQRRELEARELVERRHRFEVGVDAVEQVLGASAAARPGADRRAMLHAGGVTPAPD